MGVPLFIGSGDVDGHELGVSASGFGSCEGKYVYTRLCRTWHLVGAIINGDI